MSILADLQQFAHATRHVLRFGDSSSALRGAQMITGVLTTFMVAMVMVGLWWSCREQPEPRSILRGACPQPQPPATSPILRAKVVAAFLLGNVTGYLAAMWLVGKR